NQPTTLHTSADVFRFLPIQPADTGIRQAVQATNTTGPLNFTPMNAAAKAAITISVAVDLPRAAWTNASAASAKHTAYSMTFLRDTRREESSQSSGNRASAGIVQMLRLCSSIISRQ